MGRSGAAAVGPRGRRNIALAVTSFQRKYEDTPYNTGFGPAGY